MVAKRVGHPRAPPINPDIRGRKMFFFEKKNQKTFIRSGTRGSNRVGSPGRAQEQKFFGSFFQKRTLPSFLSQGAA